MKKYCFVAYVFLLFLTACGGTSATTRISGFSDPNYRVNFSVKKLVILCSGIQIDNRKNLEVALKKSFIKYDVHLLNSLEVFPPTQNYQNREEMCKIAKHNGADAILLLDSLNYVLTAVTETKMTWSGFVSNPYVRSDGMHLNATLIDTKNQRNIWIAENYTYGDSCEFIKSVADTIVETLSREGLVSIR